MPELAGMPRDFQAVVWALWEEEGGAYGTQSIVEEYWDEQPVEEEEEAEEEEEEVEEVDEKEEEDDEGGKERDEEGEGKGEDERDENEEYDNDKEDEAEEKEDSQEDKDENYVDKEEEEDGKEDAEVIASICESLPHGFGFCSAVWSKPFYTISVVTTMSWSTPLQAMWWSDAAFGGLKSPEGTRCVEGKVWGGEYQAEGTPPWEPQDAPEGAASQKA